MARKVKAARTAAVASGRGAAFKARVALAACKGDKIVSIVEQALAIFPNSNPSRDQILRANQVAAAGANAERLLDELTDEYYILWKTDPEQDLYRRLAAFLVTVNTR